MCGSGSSRSDRSCSRRGRSRDARSDSCPGGDGGLNAAFAPARSVLSIRRGRIDLRARMGTAAHARLRRHDLRHHNGRRRLHGGTRPGQLLRGAMEPQPQANGPRLWDAGDRDRLLRAPGSPAAGPCRTRLSGRLSGRGRESVAVDDPSLSREHRRPGHSHDLHGRDASDPRPAHRAR